MCLLLFKQHQGCSKNLTNFTLAKLDELALLVAPTIVRHAQSTNEHHNQIWI
jgi:hypothetical protein